MPGQQTCVQSSFHCYALSHLINMYIDHSLVPRPTQLSIACNMEKWGEHGNFLMWAWLNWKMAKVFWTNRQYVFRVLLNRLHAQCMVCTTVTYHQLYTCSKLPCTLAIFAVLSPVYLRTIKTMHSTIFSILTSLDTWEKIPGPPPLFHTASYGKLGGTWEHKATLI